MKILAIETSCDETAAAVIEAARGNFNILSNVVSSQVKVHAKYGGIVPEVAARLHIENILSIIKLALKQAKTRMSDLKAIAVCSGPGLVSSLMVGVETAKTLAYACNIPLIKINHIEGHLLSVENSKSKDQSLKEIQNSKFKIQKRTIRFPAVALIVSGGHTQIILVKDYLKYKLIGETLDDAAGEAFDKVAKILGLGYPGGPAISACAEKGQGLMAREIKLPRPMINSNNFDMSFSGLKTATLYSWQKLSKGVKGKKLEILKQEFAHEFQNAVVEVLTAKTIRAAGRFKAKTIILGGGVSANQALRQRFSAAAARADFNLLIPDLKLTGDNAAMIGFAAYYHIIKKDFVKPFKLKAEPNWELV